jgi:hypothetical protein
VSPDAADDVAGRPAARVPWQDRVGRLTLFSRRHRAGLLLGVALLAATLGIAVGRATAPGGDVEAREAVEANLLPLALDADGIWTSGIDDGAPVSEALVALRHDHDASLVEADLARWLEGYDSVLVRLAGADLPVSARPVQRQFMAAVTLSRDAAEVLGHAAKATDDDLRRDLTTEVGRLRQRSEQLMQSARASVSELTGGRADVSPMSPLTTFMDGGS